MSKHFTHLHLHTEYSLLDGAIKLKDLVKHAKEQEWKAIGVSDHGNIFGAVKFFQLAKKQDIKPILGVEMYFAPDALVKSTKERKYYHLILIVQNKAGYKNLCRLMAYAYQDGFYFKPRIDYRMLEKHSEGLIASTGCLGGHIPQLLFNGNIEEAQKRTNWFLDVFGKDRFFYELSPADQEEQVKLNKLLLEYGQKFGVTCTASTDAHYLRAQDREAHEVLLAIQTKDVMDNPDRFSFGDCRVYVRSTQEMLDAFPDNEEILWNTGKIADSCEFEFEFGKLLFPQSPVPKEHTQESYFKKLCEDGLNEIKQNKLIPEDTCDIYDARLKEEIDLIVKMGFVGYFLVVSDFIQWAKDNAIPVGPGRGSAAGSLVAWALKITNVDPIKYNLLFERFLNPERVSMPDIDIDFCVEQREVVINYVKEKYGHECVCQIITFGTMLAKSVIKDVARALGFPFQDANALTDLIPNQLNITLKDAFEQEPRLQSMVDSDSKIKKLFDICFKLEGLTRHASKHAAGLVIAPGRLDELLPLYIPSKTNELVAQYAMTELESLGFLKMDFLGLKNLTVIERTLKAVKKNHGADIDLDRLALDDPKVFELLGNGQTNAIFQFESNGIKEVLRKLKPDKFEDLIAVNALYRPGPLGAGMVDDYIERRHGRQEVTYMFPELKPILEETYGVIVYQEQVMKIASAIAGYTLGGADILRRAMGKKKVEVMAEQRMLFIDGAQKRNFDTKKAGELFDLMAFFAGYGFNKSHSTAYALIAYHTAYLKAHYPKEFMAASVTFETGNPDQLTHYLQEISDMGIKTILPDVNTSEIEFSAQKDGISFGLQGIKNVGQASLEDILSERSKKPFKDILDFCRRVDLRTSNKRVIENLVCAGAMDSLPGNRPQKVSEIEKIIALAQEYKEQMRTGQMGLFGLPGSSGSAGVDGQSSSEDSSFAGSSGYAFKPKEDWSDREKLEKEKEVAGFYLSSHPLKSYPALRWLETESFADALEKAKNVTSIKEPFATCAGLMQSFRVINTKKGDRMAFAQCEDLSGRAELIIFPKQFARLENLLDQYHVFVIKGQLDIASQNKCKIKVNELIPVELLFEQEKAIRSVDLYLPSSIDDEYVQELGQTLSEKGPIAISVRFSENGYNLLVQGNKKTLCSSDMLVDIEKRGVKVKLMV